MLTLFVLRTWSTRLNETIMSSASSSEDLTPMTEVQREAALKSECMTFKRQFCIVNKSVRITQSLLSALSIDAKSVEASKK